MFFFLLSIGPRSLMLRKYCSHIGLLYYPQTFQISPLVSFYEVLAARGADVYEPTYFRKFQLPPLVVFKRTQQPKVELHGQEMADKFCLKVPDFHVTFRDLLYAVNLRHGTDDFTSPPKEGVLRIFSVGFEIANLGTKGQHATSRPPKPLPVECYISASERVYCSFVYWPK